MKIKLECFFLLLSFYFILAQEFLNSCKYGVNLKHLSAGNPAGAVVKTDVRPE